MAKSSFGETTLTQHHLHGTMQACVSRCIPSQTEDHHKSRHVESHRSLFGFLAFMCTSMGVCLVHVRVFFSSVRVSVAGEVYVLCYFRAVDLWYYQQNYQQTYQQKLYVSPNVPST
jgi:hypothetical protein